MTEKIKTAMSNPIFQRLGWISIWAVISFSMVLGAYKSTIDTMQEDVKFTKTSVQQLTIDVAVVKTKLDEHIKK